ncbi:alpha/beta hydrolase [Zhihengliuella sp.]|uniref:alpha/beta hydrolase n=1 Tax=Zhihengliuella sp. TaxID=1954483 RepID=UPI002811F7AC|nr:alpha/beta hydrolase [Zhihengliuella sp.]
MRPPHPSGLTRLLVGVALLAACLALAAVALLVLGAFFPELPLLGQIGSLLSGWFARVGVAVALVLAVGLALTRWTSRRGRRRWRVVLAALGAVALLGCIVVTVRVVATGLDHGVLINPLAGPTAPRAPDAMEQYGTVPDDPERFGALAGEPLEVSVWTPTTPQAGSAPIAFFIHGGGWISGSATDDAAGMKATLADSGWLVISAEYTLAAPARPTAGIAEAQLGCAMAWAAAHAPDYGGSPGTFVSLGDSAGGNLAINAAYRGNAGTLSCPRQGPLPDVDAVAPLFPAVDPYALHADAITGGDRPGRDFTERYTGGTPAERPEVYRAVDSSTHVSPQAPPTLILQGTNDHIVRPHAVDDFAAEAAAAGVDTTLVRVPFADHVFEASPMGSQLYTEVTLRWLEDLGLSPERS